MDAAPNAPCRACGLCDRAGPGGRAILEVRTSVELKAGDRVTVEIPGPGAALSGLLLFFLPLALFIAGVLAGQALARGILPAGRWAPVLLGLLLMVGAYVAAGLYDRRLRRSPNYRPKLVDWPGRE